jgi:epoxide hydrolase-like predicted phosphatase
MIKGVLFDVGGVLINLDGYHPAKLVADFYNIDQQIARELFNKHLDKLGTEYVGEEAEEQVWKGIASDINSTKTEIPYFILHDDFENRLKKNSKVLEMLENLKEKGYIVGILSDTNIIHKKMDVLQEIYSHVDILLLSCDIGVRKPKKEAFMKALERMKLKAEEVLFIDDRENIIESAKEYGFNTVLAKNEDQIVDEIKENLKL